MIAFIIGLIAGIFLGAFIAIYTVGHITVRFPIPMDMSEIIKQMKHDPDSPLYDDEIEDDSDYYYEEDDFDEEDDFEEGDSEDSNDNLD